MDHPRVCPEFGPYYFINVSSTLRLVLQTKLVDLKSPCIR